MIESSSCEEEYELWWYDPFLLPRASKRSMSFSCSFEGLRLSEAASSFTSKSSCNVKTSFSTSEHRTQFENTAKTTKTPNRFILPLVLLRILKFWIPFMFRSMSQPFTHILKRVRRLDARSVTSEVTIE